MSFLLLQILMVMRSQKRGGLLIVVIRGQFWVFSFIICFQIMWGLYPESLLLSRRISQLPPITYDWLIIITLASILCLKLMQLILLKHFRIGRLRGGRSPNALEYSPVFHLAIVILILNEFAWNMFDLTIWITVYIGAFIVRKVLFNVKAEKDILLSNYSFNSKLACLLQKGKFLGLISSIIGILLFLCIHLTFAEISMKVTSLLAFPSMMVAVQGTFLFLGSAASEHDILFYFNQNINKILPTYKLELVEKIAANCLRIWHFSTLIKLFLASLIGKMVIFEYIWISSVLTACFLSVKALYICIGKYRNNNKLIKRFDRIFIRIASAPDQTCTICLAQLLNCRQLATCGHLFHYRCLFQWLETKMECPICRDPFPLN